MSLAWLKWGALAAAIVTLLCAVWFRDDIFQTLQDPGVPFQMQEKPPAPDYAQTSSWIAWPDGEDAGDAAPAADVFVVVPEVYKGSESWNLPIADARRREKLERIVRPNYVEPYRGAGQLYAPHYRQAALYAFLNNRLDSQSAQALAYSDVARAFGTFLARSERPIVLVGHGQGAAHAQRLLRERYDDIADRLVVAYMIDHPVVTDTLGPVRVCGDATDTGCIVAWNAVMDEPERAERLRERALVHDGRAYRPTEGRKIVCTNPLSWRPDTARVDKSQHLGGVGAVGFEPGVRPIVHARQVGAQCVDGLLQVSTPEVASLRRPRKIGGAFRTLPSNLFYEDLRVNARARVDAYLANPEPAK